MPDKPKGRFRCVACKKVWDGNELYQDPSALGVRWTCGDLFCGANVQKLPDEKETSCPTK